MFSPAQVRHFDETATPRQSGALQLVIPTKVEIYGRNGYRPFASMTEHEPAWLELDADLRS
jgi:hypothetical protein